MIIPLNDSELAGLPNDELWNLWREVQAEADRLDEMLADETRLDAWKEKKLLTKWEKANTDD